MLQVAVTSLSHPTTTFLLMTGRLWGISCWWLWFVIAMGQICELTTLSCPPGLGQDKARFIQGARNCCPSAHLGAGAAEILDTSLSPQPSQLLSLLISKLVIKVCSCCTFLNWHLGPYSSKNSHWSVLEHRLSKPSGTSCIFAVWCSSDTWQFQHNFVTLKQHYRRVFNCP